MTHQLADLLSTIHAHTTCFMPFAQLDCEQRQDDQAETKQAASAIRKTSREEVRARFDRIKHQQWLAD